MTESKEQTNKLDLPEQEEQESDQAILNRRQFIGFGASAAVAALAFPQAAQAYAEFPGMPHKERGVTQKYTSTPPAPPTTPTPPTPSSLTPPSDTNFYQPNVIASTVNGNNNYGTLSSNLEIAKQTYPDNSSTYIRVLKEVKLTKASPKFEPGPTLCVNPGDLISLKVTNNLDANTPPPPSTGGESTYCKPSVDNTPGCLNTTNLHFHGLHVSPISLKSDGTPISAGEDETVPKSSDDVLYELEPKKSHEYCPWLPAFHAPGTHWYHAHRHGSTAIQAADGIAGALIVKEPADQEICPGAPDVIMIIQEEPESLTEQNGQVTYISSLTPQEKLDRGIYERRGKQSAGTPGKFLINGDYQPTLKVQKGEIQRWRFINANSTPRAFMNLELRDSSNNPVYLYRIAVDGITLYGKKMDNKSVKVNQVLFAPGNRVDFLANLEPGTYKLQKLVDTTAQAGSTSDQLLATIEVSDTAWDSPLADKVKQSFTNLIANGIPATGKPDYLNPITTTPTPNTIPVVFQIPNPGTNPPDRVTTAGHGDFQITNTKYNPQKTNMTADLNSTQEWIIANTSNAAHPFHIHVNPFLVVATASTNNAKFTSDTNDIIYQKLTALDWTPTSNDPNGIDPTTGIDSTIWWDTFTINPGKAYKIRHRFDDYWGTYVLHCHVLIHEDQGMMWNVQINNVDNKGANPCQPLLKPVEI